MYAIVEIAGQQFKVEKDRFVYTQLLAAAEGDTLTFDKVLLVDNDGTVNVGAPVLSGAKVTGKVLGHVRGETLVVFKKKRRKGYAKRNGHRQHYTKVMIESISL
jgi:large subunit ribosomal protein L21